MKLELTVVVTVSIGVASFPPPDFAQATQSLAAADAALYAAKREGRNRVATFTP